MRPAVVIGNGPSRKGVDLTSIPYTTFGCNGIIEEFTPTYLLYGDRWSTEEIEKGGYPHQKPPPEAEKYEFESCGGAALWAALTMGFRPVYLIGFDGGQGSACPDFGMTREGLRGRDAHVRWRQGFERVVGEHPGCEVYLITGGVSSYLEGLFPRLSSLPTTDPPYPSAPPRRP